MSEYPPKACGPCPGIAHFETPPEARYYDQNTVPKTHVELKNKTTLNEQKLGVPSTYHPPDLTVSPHKPGQNIPANPAFDPRLVGNIPQCPCKTQPCCLDRPQNIVVEEPCPVSPYKLTTHTCEQKTVKFDCPEGQTYPPLGQPKGILKNSTQGGAQDICVCPPQEGTASMQPAAGRSPQAGPDLSGIPAAATEQKGRAPCYMPQPEDDIPDVQPHEMGPVGPWATGRLDWGPLAGLTGTRPVVDKYSIARFSEGEWRKHNKEILDLASTEQHKANLIDWNGSQCLQQTQADVDQNQEDNTKRLRQREQEVYRWKCELERAIAAASEEIQFVEEQRQRLKRATAVLQLPESIAGECLERRTGRLDSELVRDEVEEELIQELALTAELRETFIRTLKDVEKQMVEDKTAKQRLEYDWSDKEMAHSIEAINVALNNRSNILLFKPGAVIFPDEQSSFEYWEHFTKDTLMESEATRQRSVTLRGTLDSILVNAARDLRTQADKVEMALSKRISCTEEVTAKLENELKMILKRLADVEDLMNSLRAAIRRLDTSMKKAQTRLDNRLHRPRVENCRDEAHFGLVEEVKSIGESVAALHAQLKQAEESQASLQDARSKLEREIMVKRKTLEIDRDRTQKIRAFYPSATALTGYT